MVCAPLSGQTSLTLEQVQVRNPAAGYAPAHAGERVTVHGTINSRVFHGPDYSLIGLEDQDYGALLYVRGRDSRLNALLPGDDVQVNGTVSVSHGIAVVEPESIVKTGARRALAPLEVDVDDLLGFRHLGRLVRTEGRIREVGDTENGAYLMLDTPLGGYRLFIPRAPNQPVSFGGFAAGDKVRATGVAYQFCSRPPFNRYFQMLVYEPAAIARTGRNWPVPPVVLGCIAALLVVAAWLMLTRERRLRRQRERLRKTYHLSEEILSASSVETILKRLRESLPEILGVTGVHLYVYDRANKSLESVAGENERPVSISLSSPPEGTQAGAVACFHYRTLLAIPDIDRSPFPIGAAKADTPKSLVFVPMLAQGEVLGVLELDQEDRAREFTTDEQELAQHLGNQIGVAVRLLDQRMVQEQLFRTEKLAAVGRLISGVVNELRSPLASISDLAARALERVGVAAERDVAAIAAEARKASAMVERLVSFAATEQEAHPVSISALLRNLIEFREHDCKASGIRIRDLTTREPLYVLGSEGQLEQVFLNLLVHAEQSLAQASQKVITIRTSVLAKRLLVEISFTGSVSRKPEETASILGVTRSVIAGHGGEVRLIEKNNAEPRFEVELPTTSKERVGAASAGNGNGQVPVRRLTVLVIEPEEAAQRQIMTLLEARGCRVVPVDNSDTGLELALRMRFDVAFCSVHAPGLNWVELSERMQSRVAAFALVPDAYDGELAADFEGDGRFVIPKPFQEGELERVLQTIEPAAAAFRHGAA